ncbi:putative radical SAM enzyme, TIGR03279 family [Natronincola peptidivorans]|uniref:Putative radical SAM enzyme, TIGR03279 family n=1 Tax=Natronincola peptidivorans TaxID=426128 RepID=A0A1H9Y8D7_9FIRM|nr:putative radical SAM enzyme, TIGR03279 family [Natronincola peptidivorans]
MKESSIKNIISKVNHDSIAEEVGLEVGDVLLSINGEMIEDIIEYKFYLAEEYLEIEIEKPDGEQWVIEIDKDYDEDLGIEFENPIIAEAKSCKNKCMFCFIDQLPKDMRKSLYFKDDDSRLSFLHGNYITLTNMRDEDIDKIIQYRISPINISVHTTNGQLRKKMLNNPKAGNILGIIKKLADNHIEMNCQIVLCHCINDGEELDNTLKDLGELSHAINSVAVVPVGLTRYREKLYPLQPFYKTTALNTIQQVESWQKKFHKTINRSLVHLSDEFYLLAEMPFPAYEDYDGFSQLENGVGMVVKFKKEFYDHLQKLKIPKFKSAKKVTVLTGTLIHNTMNELCQALNSKVDNFILQAIAIPNDYFGGQVSVTGLITATDILNRLKGIDLGEKIIIPISMLKSEEEVFLDDITVTELQNKLEVKVQVCEVEGSAFIDKALE